MVKQMYSFMAQQESILEEFPVDYLEEVPDFICFPKQKKSKEKLHLTMTGKHVLKKDWLLPEESEV